MTDRIVRMLRLPEVLKARGGISKSKHYWDIAHGKFPPAMKLGARTSVWSEEDVISEQQRVHAERDGPAR
jgi:predicted DNA-binding transcriptional regulator AlpA